MATLGTNAICVSHPFSSIAIGQHNTHGPRTAWQAFIHNPPLRNYFLSDCHTPRTCPVKQEGNVCFACELAQVYKQVRTLLWSAGLLFICRT
jgi:hypothetical protein